MKITKEQLRQVIKEELEAVLSADSELKEGLFDFLTGKKRKAKLAKQRAAEAQEEAEREAERAANKAERIQIDQDRLEKERQFWVPFTLEKIWDAHHEVIHKIRIDPRPMGGRRGLWSAQKTIEDWAADHKQNNYGLSLFGPDDFAKLARLPGFDRETRSKIREGNITSEQLAEDWKHLNCESFEGTWRRCSWGDEDRRDRGLRY